MYEGITYDVILERMLNRVSDKFDKREGSVIFDTHSPTAIELQILYLELDAILRETYGETASREFLIKRCRVPQRLCFFLFFARNQNFCKFRCFQSLRIGNGNDCAKLLVANHTRCFTLYLVFSICNFFVDAILRETYGETASREFLIKRCRERGIVPYEATKAGCWLPITPGVSHCTWYSPSAIFLFTIKLAKLL